MEEFSKVWDDVIRTVFVFEAVNNVFEEGVAIVVSRDNDAVEYSVRN